MIKHAMTKLGLTLAVALTAASPVLASSEGDKPPAIGTRADNIASVQRGAKLFFNYCVGCHSLQFMRYSRIADDLGLSEDEVVQNFAAFTNGRIGDTVVSSMPEADAVAWFGKAPPDLSLEARSKGPDWIADYLKSFYVDHSRPLGWNNKRFPGASMPNVLWEMQGIQHAEMGHAKEGGGEAHIEGLKLVTPGTQSEAQFHETVKDITSFLQYVGEPAALKRQSMGAWVVLYLAFFTFLAWLLKKEYWKDVH